MRRLLLTVSLGILFLADPLCGADDSTANDAGFRLVFTSFRGNGEDGLHLAWSQDGYTWTPLKNDKPLLRPEVGGGLMRDPQILQGPEGTFHMVWTTAWNKHGIGYANSKDLIHWSPQKLLDVMQNEPQARNVWAPELFYDATRKQFMIFWASTIPGRFAETDKTGDGGYNHRMHYTLTADFERLEPAKLLYDHGFNVIDATLVQDGKRFLMFLKDETRHPPAKNLRVATAEAPAGPYGPPSAPITGKYWAEGPSAIKLGDKWFVYFDRYTEHRYGLVTSPDLVRWEDESDKVRFPADHRHGSVLPVSHEILKGLLTGLPTVPRTMLPRPVHGSRHGGASSAATNCWKRSPTAASAWCTRPGDHLLRGNVCRLADPKASMVHLIACVDVDCRDVTAILRKSWSGGLLLTGTIGKVAPTAPEDPIVEG